MTKLEQNDSRSGVAIIIVLGVLSVLMVLAVAFAVSMRTESAAAGNYADIVKSRALVHTALARALADLDQDLGTSSNGASYPAHWSQQAMDTNMANAVHLYIGEATHLLPQGIYEAAAKLPSPGLNNGAAENVDDPNASWNPGSLAGFGIQTIGGGEGVVVNNEEKTLLADINVGSNYRVYDPAVPLWTRIENGRVAYLIVNLSGLLDAHYVGGSPRMLGTDVGEIELEALPDLTDEALFITDRDSDFYETLYALDDRNTGLVNSGPANLGVYSVCPAAAAIDDVGGTNIPPVLLTANDPTMVAALETAMRAGSAAPEVGGPWGLAAQQLAMNKLDYEDANSEPQSLYGPYVEAVPMLNEVWVEHLVPTTNNLNGGMIQVWVECAYPFAEDSSLSFEVNAEVSIVGAAFAFSPLPGPPPIPIPAQTMSPYPIAPVAMFSMSGPIPPGGLAYTVQIENMRVDIQGGGTTVDQIPSPMMLTVAPSPIVAGTPVIGPGKDVLDPVLNWHQLHWDLSTMPSPSNPFSYTNTKNAANHCTIQFWQANRDACDTDPSLQPTYLHIANAAMQTPGEIGCLYSPGGFAGEAGNPGGFPLLLSQISPINTDGQWIGPRLWRTVRLYDHGVCELPAGYLPQWNRLLDYITVEPGEVYYGRVNPNTEVADVLAAVLNDMPVDPLPGGLSNRLTEADAMLVASSIIDQTVDPMESVSDLGRKDIADAIFQGLAASSMAISTNASEIQKEAIFRNCPGLLHTRQNLFLILLAGQTARDPSTFGPPFGVPRTDQRAMAVVWRDPVADANGRHPCFVRWFTWLTK